MDTRVAGGGGGVGGGRERVGVKPSCSEKQPRVFRSDMAILEGTRKKKTLPDIRSQLRHDFKNPL